MDMVLHCLLNVFQSFDYCVEKILLYKGNQYKQPQATTEGDQLPNDK